MPILSLYILKQQVKPLFLSVFLFLVILLLNRVFELINLVVGKGVPAGIVGKMLLYSLPFILSLVIPMAVMISVIVSFGSMSEKYEIIGMQSSGISLMPLLLPLFILYLSLFVVLVFFSNNIVPSSNKKLKDTVYRIARMRPSSTVEEGTYFSSYDSRYIIFIDKIYKNSKIEKIYIKEKIKPDRWRIITSPYGFISSSGRNVLLILHKGNFTDIRVGRVPDFMKGVFEQYTIAIPIEDSLKENNRRRLSDREMTIGMLKSRIDSIASLKGISSKRKKMAINRYLVEIHKKIAIPFASIVFLFIGAPIGILMRKGNIGVAVGAGLIVFILYYALLIGGEQISDRGVLSPFIGIWLPNIIFSIIGVILMFKAWKGKIITLSFRRKRDDI